MYPPLIHWFGSVTAVANCCKDKALKFYRHVLLLRWIYSLRITEKTNTYWVFFQPPIICTLSEAKASLGYCADPGYVMPTQVFISSFLQWKENPSGLTQPNPFPRNVIRNVTICDESESPNYGEVYFLLAFRDRRSFRIHFPTRKRLTMLF